MTLSTSSYLARILACGPKDCKTGGLLMSWATQFVKVYVNGAIVVDSQVKIVPLIFPLAGKMIFLS